MFVCCECCVLSGRGLCDELSLVQRSPTDCGASLYVWSRKLVNEEALAHWALSCRKQTNSYTFQRRVPSSGSFRTEEYKLKIP
jgi:hypothetical protein